MSNDITIKRQIVTEKKVTSSKDVPRIWNVNPSYKDTNLTYMFMRIGILATLIIFFISMVYLSTHSFSIAIGVGSTMLSMFLLTFCHKTSSLFSLFQRTRQVNPFEDILFFMEHEQGSTIYLTHTKDQKHTALKIFKIEVIPENVQANLNSFIKALSEYKNLIQFSYQIIQTPRIRNDTPLEESPILTSIYFCIYHACTGSLKPLRFRKLKERLQKLEGVLRSNFVGNFHHYQIKLLSGINLINALRTYFFRATPATASSSDEFYQGRPVLTLPLLMKASVIFIIALVSFILLSSFNIAPLINLTITIGLIILVISFWWRELLFLISRRTLLKSQTILPINPFFDTRFFTFQGISDTFFAYIDGRILLGIKMYNLVYAFPPSYCRLDKFIQGIMNQKISFGYTCMGTPISYETFYKKGLDYLNEKTRYSILGSNWRLETKLDEINWMAMRSGIWKTILTISTSEFELIDDLSRENILNLEDRLALKSQILYNTFNINFFNYKLIQLQRAPLRSGLMCELLKTPLVSVHGSRLNYLLFQGKALVYLTEIVSELKKGITTRIASEFNTPLQLNNSITLGHTVNTEMLEEEMPFGFTKDQINNIIITNGTVGYRDLTAMKLVAELVDHDIPSLIFDFKGTWSRLIHYFEGTQFVNDFLYFKLGSAFSLDPLTSDMDYDKDNMDFLNYMFDAYALAFKKNERVIDIMRSTILNNPNMDMTSLNLKLINQNTWEKTPGSDVLLSLFGDFTQQDEQYLHISPQKSADAITFQHFINNKKTVIIDLSISNDYTKQIFLVFLILSKIIHYITSGDTKMFTPKILVIPHSDLFFESYWLDKYSDYGKINKFLDPLIEHGFGLVLMANQAHYLHHNLYTYFNNIITFRATDKRDIAALSSLMSLQELEGTGYYSRSRNQTYQIRYLMIMQENEAIVKRSDVYQAFPVHIDWEDIKSCELLREDEIVAYMAKQGFNLKDTEQKILDEIKRNLFQKDLGIYEGFTPEVKQFLASMCTVDQVGALYEKKLKKELKAILYPKASKLFKDKMDVKNCRDDIFTILVRHGYLVENHPKTAGGSESIRTSYSVGRQYQKALEDEFASNQPYTVETIDQELNIPFEYPEEVKELSRMFIIQSHNLKKAISREFSNFFFELVTAHGYMTKERYQDALKIERDLIGRFLTEICKHYNNVDQVSPSELYSFIELITQEPTFGFTFDDLKGHIDKFHRINFQIITYEQIAHELYEDISTFFEKIQTYILNEEEV
ncbi:MAG: hypothetical protein ACFFA3_11205 [Promethearchaeota archaeon]